jgi:hypothetical protein
VDSVDDRSGEEEILGGQGSVIGRGRAAQRRGKKYLRLGFGGQDSRGSRGYYLRVWRFFFIYPMLTSYRVEFRASHTKLEFNSKSIEPK